VRLSSQFLSAAAATASKSTAAGWRGVLSFRPLATALPPLSPRNEKGSGEAEFLLHLFGLKQDPFSDAPDEWFFYTNAAIRRTYRELINALAETPGVAALTGEGGTGKTILLQRLCSELRAAGHLVIGRCRGGLVFDELIAAIAEELKIPGDGGRLAWRCWFRAALERNKGARPPILVIDDAERLGGDIVANLAQLLAGPADCSLRILLCGRPELATRLELPGLAELKRMTSVVCRLERIDDNDAASYIFHRLRRAGHHGTTLFSAAAINTAVAKAAGLPRRINRVCARSLVVAAAAGRPVITSEMVEDASTELIRKDASAIETEHGSVSARRDRTTIAASAGVVAAGIFLCAWMGREQIPEAIGMLSALHAMATSRDSAAVMRQAVATLSGGGGIPPEGRSRHTELIGLHAEEAPQLGQTVRWAFDDSSALPPESSPQSAALPAASPNLPQLADPCRDARQACSNSQNSPDRGNALDGGPITAPTERPDETRGQLPFVVETEPMARAEQRLPVQVLISRAQSQLEAGHIAAPTGNNAVETYRQLFVMHPESAEAGELLEQIRLALWARARNAVRDGKWEEAQRFYELAVHPAIDIEDDEPLAEAATQHIDTEVATSPEPVLSGDPTQGARAPDRATPAETGNTEKLGQLKPEQVLKGSQETADEKPESAAPAQASDDVGLVVPATETAAPAQAAASGEPVGAGVMPKISNEGSRATVAKETAQQEGAASSGSPPAPTASPPNSAAPAVAPAMTMPAASPIPAEIVAVLIKRGDELLKIGDISGARLAYERAAAGGSAGAMTALGMTYDPSFLNRSNAIGIRADPAKAAEWYRKAATLGDAAAAARISQLPALAK
jgi:general secretion pathway protein A